MDKERLPQWAWLLLGLFAVAVSTQLVYVAVLEPIGLPQEYLVVLLIANMSLVVIYLGIWYDDDRSHYWERPRVAIGADVCFVLLGAITASGIAVAVGLDREIGQIPREFIAMIVGFASAWALFYFRNTDLYDFGS